MAPPQATLLELLNLRTLHGQYLVEDPILAKLLLVDMAAADSVVRLRVGDSDSDSERDGIARWRRLLLLDALGKSYVKF